MAAARLPRATRALSTLPPSARAAIGLDARNIPHWPVLFTPGPLTLSASTKAAMLRDVGSRDGTFTRVVADIRAQLLALAGVAAPAHECVIVQGAGTMGVEAVIGSAVPRGGRLLVGANGAYGERMLAIARALNIDAVAVRGPERAPLDVRAVAAAAAADAAVTHVAVVHHETTAGVLNDVPALGAALAAQPRAPALIVDAMSSFGAHQFDAARARAAFIVSSANKCIEGVPGFSFVIAERAALAACAGRARSLALDLHAQAAGLAAGGQFRFTPPTHALLAFSEALREHAAEGGAAGRLARYARTRAALLRGMARLGFAPYVPAPAAGEIITTFLAPRDARFDFPAAYAALAARGFVLYPGKMAKADSFRIGSIGRIFEADADALVAAFEEVLVAQGVKLPVTQIEAPEE